MKHFLFALVLPLFNASAAIDTLRDTSDIGDCIIYSWADCTVEVSGEDCRRFNSGLITNLQVGFSGTIERRGLLVFPTWNDSLPDSSKLLLYCKYEMDGNSRRIFLYPVTKQIFEGSEIDYNIGNYPDPDSGVTWNHAWLDVGDGDSSNWDTPGGDFTTAIACTTVITGTGQYFAFDNFNRILTYWDTSGQSYGIILINQNAFPVNISMKTFGMSEYDTTKVPLLILYYPGDGLTPRRRRIIEKLLED